MITLDEAVESAKLSAGYERLLRQQHYEDLLQQLSETDRYPFTIALMELGINPRTGENIDSTEVDNFLDRQGSPYHKDPYNPQHLENRLVHASRHIDAGWWDDIKTKVKDLTGWGDNEAETFLEEQQGVQEPMSGTDTENYEELYGVPSEGEITEDLLDFDYVGEDEPLYEQFEGYEPPDGYDMPVMHAVDSSNLEALGYDEEENLLYIVFKAKRNTPQTLYRYFDVSGAEFGNLLSAESQGKYFHQNIREQKLYDKLDVGLVQ